MMICPAPTLRTPCYATMGPHNYKVRLCRPRFSHTTTKVFRSGSQANGCLLTELPRIPILGTWVNKLPVNAPNPSGWHHAHVADLLEKTRVGKEEPLCR